MKFNNPYYAQASLKRSTMWLQSQGQNVHHQHIEQFCEYADLMAESVKAEIIEMLPQLIEQYIKSPKYEVVVDEKSLKRVQQKIRSALDGIFGKR